MTDVPILIAKFCFVRYFHKIHERLHDESVAVKNMALQAFELLAEPGEQSIIKPIQSLLEHCHVSYRLAGVRAITVAMAHDPDACLELLHPFLQDCSHFVVKAALDGVVNISTLCKAGSQSKSATHTVAKMLHNSNADIRVRYFQK
jgi:hypothetical protein